MRIFQISPSLSFGDAVSNDALAIRRILQDEGYDTSIYALVYDNRFPKGTVAYLDEMPEPEADDLVLYHGAIGTGLTEKLASFRCKKVMIYHNITPPEFFKPYSRPLSRLTKMGYAEIREMAKVFDRCIADSEYNKQNLRETGYECEIDVCPIVIPFEDYDQEPDAETIAKYKDDGITNLLFVGRIAPNKRQEDIISAFAAYQKAYNPDSRLFLVGSCGDDLKNYETRLKDYISKLGLEGKAFLTGHIPFKTILAYYRLADVFVCMSEHEGFCVPVPEAQHFGKPIVAYRSSAVPETMGDGGLLVDTKDPYVVAAVINRVLTDEGLKGKILKAQQEKLDELSYEGVKQIFLKCFKNICNSEFRIQNS